MKGWNKFGQFYLIAAILIISVVVGFVAVNNYSKNKNPEKIYDLGKELGIEGGKVLEYGVINNKDVKESFASNFTKYSSEDERQIYFIFGDKELITVLTSTDLARGKISIGGANIPMDEKIITNSEGICINEEEKIICTINDVPYEFELNEGENFYFIISQKNGEEEHVVTG